MKNSKISLLVFLIIQLVYSGYSQENFIFERELKYSFTKNTKITEGQIIDFEDAVNHEIFGSIPVLNFQIPLDFEIDSLDINVFDSKVISNISFPSIEQIQKTPKYHYEIQHTQGKIFLNIFFRPFIIDSNQVFAYEKIKLLITCYKSDTKTKNTKVYKWNSNSVLANGDWYKVKISKSAIYKVSGSDIESMGISLSNLTTDKIRLYGNGGGMYPEANYVFFRDDLTENAIEIVDQNNNGLFESNDYFLFFGQGPNIWNYSKSSNTFSHSQHLYDNYAYYFITIASGTPNRILNLSQSNKQTTHFVNDFTDYQYLDKDSINLIKSGKQWFGDEYNIILNYNYSFIFPNLKTSTPVKIRTSVAARSTSNSTFNLLANGNLNSIIVPGVYGTYNSDYAAGKIQEFSINSSSDQINISSSYIKSTTSSIGWLDYIEVIADRALSLAGNQLIFRNINSIGQNNVTQFSISNCQSNIKVWDITNPINPLNIQLTQNGTSFSYNIETDSFREFIAHQGSYLSVSFVEKIQNQNLHAVGNVDYVICYNTKFKDQAIELANYHQNTNNLNVYLVDQKILFNEFSGGAADIAALRNFMKMLYDKAQQNSAKPPRYLLLIGDASYDYKNRVNSNTNYILTYESNASLSPLDSYSSDDFYGLLDDNEGLACAGTLDISIGRFPVSTTSEVENLINKVKRYQEKHQNPTGSNFSYSPNSLSNMADWRNQICFIGDDQDQNVHVSQADYMAEIIRNGAPRYNVDKIYLDAYVQKTTPGGQRYPEAKNDLNLRVSNGALFINYTGHGGEIGLAHESLLEINDILSWNNANNLPLFITATCEFSRYDDPTRVSAGEYTYLQPNGGMIALLTTSRLTFSSSNYTLNKYIVNNIFKNINGEYPTMGDLIRLSKVSAGSVMNNRNFVLLGDPAIRLSYPEYDVVTATINGKPISSFNDTISSLDLVTITGYIENDSQLISNFNGFVYPTIFDKPQEYTTLANDNDSYPYNFKLQKNIIYKGKATVTNGQFSFSFIVPKDINYSLGMGKISYYAENGQIDANGYFDSILIGGSNNSIIVDNQGPEIELFMNDTNFINGGITNEKPVLLAFLADANGINTTGNGIGHDITLTLDNNSSNSVTLNNFYQSKANSYQSGYVIYPLNNLTEGMHTINLKAWDVLNNSNDENLDFIVANSENTLISALSNFPNPFIDYTNFVFEHNMAGNQMDIKIEIYNINGRLERVLNTNIVNSGFRIAPNELKWTGHNENGQKLNSGVYNYRIFVTTDVGQYETKGGQMVLLN
jgi:hypothetical protein